MRAGVVVTGPGRSGTSMVAGLLAAHGVFFGACKPGDSHNPKGYIEHPAIPLPRASAPGWPGKWWEALERDGWDGRAIWGAKQLTTRWRWLLQLQPSVIAVTIRPEEEIRASLLRFGKTPGWSRAHLAKHRAGMRSLLKAARCSVVMVHTDEVVRGEFRSILPVFRLLGLRLDEEMALDWIDPALWNREVVLC